eukprot:6908022-Karenia_brevis.AAC.2
MLRQAWEQKAEWELMRNAWLGELCHATHGFIFAEKGKNGTTDGHHHRHYHRHVNLDHEHDNDKCDGDNTHD